MLRALARTAVLPAAYLAYAAHSVGLHERLALAAGPISLEQIPDRAARRHGDRPLFTSATPITWSVPALPATVGATSWSAVLVRDTAGHVAAALRHRLGVGHGDRVAILKANHFDYHLLHLAVVRAGGIACPMNGMFAAEKVGPYLTNVDARVLVTDPATLRRVLSEGGDLGGVASVVLTARRADADAKAKSGGKAGGHTEVSGDDLGRRLQAVHGDAVALHWIEELLATVDGPVDAIARGKQEPLYLVHSSGTTGFPKAVILQNGRQSHAVRGWLSYVHASRHRDRGLFALPNNHQAVILSFNATLLAGISVHWYEGYGREGFNAAEVVRELSTGRYTGFFGFPITYTQLKEQELDPAKLRQMRYWASTADASHEAIIRTFTQFGSAFRRLGLPVAGSVFLDAQGSSEVGTPSVLRYYTTLTRRYQRRIGRLHSTPFGPKVRVTRDGVPVPRETVGRLEVRGRTVFEAYWNNHSLTYKAHRDGWFFTGDVARIGADGHVVQLDREVDVIATRDGDVHSLPIEEVLHHHPAVYDVCVYGARQDDGSQRPAAAVAVRPQWRGSAGALADELNALLDPAARLCRVDILDWAQFPIGVTGKTLKRVFRERTEPVPTAEANRPIVLAQARRPREAEAPAQRPNVTQGAAG
ncbi:class I adenylate-forming enzyme family protein [Frankia sp. QA3]|uniref:AMP-binding protein n=1 Tax=Frankia sp. QA3 TaxID=710111 RepID=UPI000269C04A|nr:class I adenylate-forming enzyme family protein [Frankia sp. QA3]EIV91999.1 acyl-CoA synthetase (AMP-forming)/AMP-acid ligase II [Frankia sp. QA3]